ncbi:TetR/AcrR family transcriptional regulator [Chitinibacter sp. ZOR0017]|uniref:TetR/AcrR family transcriptional regulator n=1 Tax=Chitinibacter sp. ZOR0017 TaxID=1339254 RepID=UPI000AAB2722|nr:TetR/AcrR family transcriptional regulator [Chitinibacter sp. ZOR0017]
MTASIHFVVINMEIKKTRGRPRAFDRTQALELALHLFWAKGYEGASLSDLTSTLGINAPSLYAAFESKPALYREALDLYLAQQYEHIGALLAAAPSAREGLEAMLRGAAVQFTSPDHPPGCPIASGVLRCAEANAAIGELTAEHRRSTRAMMLARLQQGQAAGELPAQIDTQALAGFYAGVIQGMSVQAIDGASCADLQKMVDLAMQAWPA